MATQKQIEANRKNAALSKGPTTEAGKIASRANALKHGLACETIDIEAQADPAFQARREAWAAQYQPSGESDDWALDRAVAASFRIERCEVAFDVAVAETSERARVAWDEDQELKAANLGKRLAMDPCVIARKLATSRHGIDLMIAWWERLGESLAKGEDWTEVEASTALDLLGLPTHLRSGRTPIDDPTKGANLPFRQNLVIEEIIRLESLLDNGLGLLDKLDRERAIQGSSAMFTTSAKLVLRYEREAWARYRESVKVLTTAGPKPEVKPEPQPKPVVAPTPTPVPTPEVKQKDDSQEATIERNRLELAQKMVGLGIEGYPPGLDQYLAVSGVNGTNPISEDTSQLPG